MAVPRRSTRSRFVVVLCLLSSVSLITIDSRANGSGALHSVRSRAADVLSPVQQAAVSVTHPLGDFVDSLVHRGDLKAENERLRRENEQLRRTQLNQPEAERELRVLKEQLKLDFTPDVPTVAAQVINLSPSNFASTVVINRGTEDGVGRNMPVAVATGLVGRVESVDKHQAVVRLITDPDVHVGVLLSQSGANSITDGAGPGNLLGLEMVPKETRVGRDEKVFTSGLGNAYPKGIPVGEVKAARMNPGADFLEVQVAPTAPLSTLEFVQVLQWFPR